MLKRRSMGLLSAVLIGAMLPGVAGAEDNAGAVGGHATIVGAGVASNFAVGASGGPDAAKGHLRHTSTDPSKSFQVTVECLFVDGARAAVGGPFQAGFEPSLPTDPELWWGYVVIHDASRDGTMDQVNWVITLAETPCEDKIDELLTDITRGNLTVRER